jgi:hypothetical protein
MADDREPRTRCIELHERVDRPVSAMVESRSRDSCSFGYRSRAQEEGRVRTDTVGSADTGWTGMLMQQLEDRGFRTGTRVDDGAAFMPRNK